MTKLSLCYILLEFNVYLRQLPFANNIKQYTYIAKCLLVEAENSIHVGLNHVIYKLIITITIFSNAIGA